jgi:excinuclease UvrABC nuclease subunit
MMRLFLSGKGAQTLDNISQKMQNASKSQDFELAAHLPS